MFTLPKKFFVQVHVVINVGNAMLGMDGMLSTSEDAWRTIILLCAYLKRHTHNKVRLLENRFACIFCFSGDSSVSHVQSGQETGEVCDNVTQQ